MVINKKATKIYKLVESLFVGVVFVEVILVGTTAVFTISSHVITELSIILPKYLIFWQLHVAGFQIQFLMHALCLLGFLHSHWHLYLFLF